MVVALAALGLFFYFGWLQQHAPQMALGTALTRSGTFWLYAGIGVLAIIFILTRVPETRGRSLEQIQHQLGVR